MYDEIPLKIESAFIEAKSRKYDVDWTYEVQQLSTVCSITIGDQVGCFAIGRTNKVKKNAVVTEDNRWRDAGLTGVEKAVYYLKYGVLPEQRHLQNQVVIEELPAKSEHQREQ